MVRFAAVFILTAMFLMVDTEECFAPAEGWGEPCMASNSVKGSSGNYITYVFDARSPISIFCQAVGRDSYPNHSTCSWGWHYIGSVANKSSSLLWDSANDYPAIRCYGFPKGGYFDWSYFVLPGKLSCVSTQSMEFASHLPIDANDRRASFL